MSHDFSTAPILPGMQQSIEIGPIHSGLPGAMKLGLGLRGDELLSVDCEFGFLTRGIIAQSVGKTLFRAQSKIARVDAESALIIDQITSEAIEVWSQISAPDRAEWIREITLYLSDLSSALKYLALMSKRMRLLALMQIILKHREDLLDLIELLTGSRFGYDYVVPGGTRYDLSDGFLERLEKWMKAILADFPRIEAMFFYIPQHVNHLKDTGLLVDSSSDSESSNFLSRSSLSDSRIGPVSSVYSRIIYTIESIKLTNHSLLELLNEQVMGPHRVQIEQMLSHADLKISRDTYRGKWLLQGTLSEDGIINHLEVITPSLDIIKSIPEALHKESIDDLPLILQSLNFTVPEIDQ